MTSMTGCLDLNRCGSPVITLSSLRKPGRRRMLLNFRLKFTIGVRSLVRGVAQCLESLGKRLKKSRSYGFADQKRPPSTDNLETCKELGAKLDDLHRMGETFCRIRAQSIKLRDGIKT